MVEATAVRSYGLTFRFADLVNWTLIVFSAGRSKLDLDLRALFLGGSLLNHLNLTRDSPPTSAVGETCSDYDRLVRATVDKN